MGSDKEKALIKQAISAFLSEFGLRAFPGETFRISGGISYFTGPGEAGGELMLYTQRKQPDGSWLDFAKGNPIKLRAEMVMLPLEPWTCSKCSTHSF